jgi:hypothetical protein
MFFSRLGQIFDLLERDLALRTEGIQGVGWERPHRAVDKES